MRVLLTTDTVGGVWTYTKELTEGLLHSGHSVALASFGRLPHPEQQMWATELTKRSGHRFCFYPSAIPLEWMPDNHLAYKLGAALLERVADDFKPTLLHTSQFCFGRLTLSIPNLVVAHSDVLSWADACTPSRPPASSWLAQYRQLVQEGLDGADVIVAPTRSMQDALASHFTPPSRRRVIPNGRTLQLSEPAPPRQPQAVSAGRLWDPAKNVALLQQVRACPVVIAGAGASHNAEAATGATTRFLDSLPEAELLHLFRSSKIYIAASLYEPFGLAPLEAALCGCAIVANNISSLREVWGAAALYFTTIAELEQHLTALINNDTLFRQQQRLCFDRARSLSAEAMSANYLSLYDELCPTIKAARASHRHTLTHAN